MFTGYEKILRTSDIDSLSKAFHHCMRLVSFTHFLNFQRKDFHSFYGVISHIQKELL